MPTPSPPPTTDSATFVSDVTLPDDSVVSPGQALHKVWRVRNSGTSTWGSGYQLVFVGGHQMGAPAGVSIPATAPGATAALAVDMTAPSAGGTYTGRWRLRNPQGTYFGDELWIKISVVSQTSNDHIAAFSADPPSPSSASTVRLNARVNWWPQFRAMRVRVDDQVIGETAATEYAFTWNTGSAASGAHTVVLEVADQTDTSWSRPERRVLVYTLQGAPAPANHAPNRPTPSSPYDWYVYYSGNTAQLCAQANGDPDGDAITAYYFDVYDSAQLWNSGWVGTNCVTTGALGPYNYQWRVRVRDSRGAVSDWSDTWHFTLVNPSLSITELYFQPQDANNEQVKIRACTAGQGGVGITMRVSVNDANDGSGNGTWHIIKELGVPCFNDVDAPVWNTLEYGDGPHRVRVEAHGASTGWDGAAVREETYTLPHRRPASPRLLAPIPPSGNIREPIYLNSRTITFRWKPAIRANTYTLHIGASPSPKDDPAPVFRRTFGSNITEHTVTFSQDYSTLYWQVSAANDVGTHASGDQLFGIDRLPPSCTVQALPAVTYESVFRVSWGGLDSLAGIRTFDIQYLDSGRGTWSDWLTGIPASKTYELFTGQPGHTYAFRCRATDNANNSGTYPVNADTSVKVDPAARPPTPWWNSAYSSKRNIVILNNMSNVQLPTGYPVRLRFDASTTPTAAEIYNASLSNPKCNDLRIVYNDSTELDRVVQNCSSSAIDIWFRTQVKILAAGSDNTSHQLYYGNPNSGNPPGGYGTVFYPPLDTGTRALLYFQEGSGTTAYDSSGNGLHGAINPAVTWAQGKWGRALDFPGYDGRGVNLGAPPALNLSTMSFEAWFKLDPFADTQQMAGQLGGGGNAGQNKWVLTYESPGYGDPLHGKISVHIWKAGGGEVTLRTNRTINDYNWHHIAFTFDGSNALSIYLDGSLDNTIQTNGGWASTNTTFEIGNSEDHNRFAGRMQNVRISHVARPGSDFQYGSFAAITTEPTLAAGDPIAPPITASPDLAVLGLTTYPNPGGGVLVQAVFRNQGNVSTQNGFFTDLYADHLPTGTGDYTGSIHFWVASPIEAGQTVTLTTVITDLPGIAGMGVQDIGAVSEISSTLYAQVDSTGVVSETNNLNNISGGAEVCVASADAYESDDTAATAKPITLGTSQAHNFDSLADEDWVRFAASGGVTYTVRTDNLGPRADTYLYIYDTDGTTLLAANDDYGGSLASRLDWTAPTTGTYYLLVKHWNPNVGGCGTAYDLTVMRALTNKVFLPVVLRNR